MSNIADRRNANPHLLRDYAAKSEHVQERSELATGTSLQVETTEISGPTHPAVLAATPRTPGPLDTTESAGLIVPRTLTGLGPVESEVDAKSGLNVQPSQGTAEERAPNSMDEVSEQVGIRASEVNPTRLRMQGEELLRAQADNDFDSAFLGIQPLASSEISGVDALMAPGAIEPADELRSIDDEDDEPTRLSARSLLQLANGPLAVSEQPVAAPPQLVPSAESAGPERLQPREPDLLAPADPAPTRDAEPSGVPSTKRERAVPPPKPERRLAEDTLTVAETAMAVALDTGNPNETSEPARNSNGTSESAQDERLPALVPVRPPSRPLHQTHDEDLALLLGSPAASAANLGAPFDLEAALLFARPPQGEDPTAALNPNLEGGGPQSSAAGNPLLHPREAKTRPSNRPPAQVVAPGARSDSPWASSVAPKRSLARALPLSAPLLAFVASLVVTVVVLTLLLQRKGAVLVTASDASSAPVPSTQVFVDGKLGCEPVPCRLNALSAGAHLIRVQAPGYVRGADQPVAVRAGEDAAAHFTLVPVRTSGIDLRADIPGLRVTLDGVSRGSAPVVIQGLIAGEHSLRLDGNSAYAPFEQKFALVPDEMLTLEPKLAMLHGFINVRAGTAADGATVELWGDGQRRAVGALPARLEVSPSGRYRVRATRPGYTDFQAEIGFADNRAEKEVRVDLVPVAAPVAPSVALAAIAPEVVPLSEDLSDHHSTGKTIVGDSAKPPGSAAALSLNSIPISSVILDGRPAGLTPTQVPVVPGAHSVVFVHPTLGRKSVNVNVSPGKTAVAAVRF